MAGWPASIPTIGSGGAATSAQFNDYRDALKAVGDLPPAYTPVLTAITVNPTMGSSSLTGMWRKLDRWVDYQIDLTIGAGFAAGTGRWVFKLPPAVPLNGYSGKWMGTAMARDASSSGLRAFTAFWSSSTTISLVESSVAVMSDAAPWAWATGDVVSIDGHYVTT